MTEPLDSRPARLETTPDPTPDQRQAAEDAEYEKFYPSTPLPRMSDEDFDAYRTYYPNIQETR